MLDRIRLAVVSLNCLTFDLQQFLLYLMKVGAFNGIFLRPHVMRPGATIKIREQGKMGEEWGLTSLINLLLEEFV